MFSNYVAGIGFSGKKAQLVVVEVKKRSLRLRHVSEYENDSDEPLWFLGPILRREPKIVRKVKRVSIALDNALVFMHNFPTDSTLGQGGMNEHLTWELAQFVPGYTPKEYVNDVHVLKTHAQERITDVFVVAARRAFVQEIQQSLAQKRYDLGIADTNQFGAEYALAASYPETRTKKVALVGIMRDRADLGILTNGRPTVYRYQNLGSETDPLDFIAPHIQTEAVSDIFLYGSHADTSLSDTARGRFGVEVSLLNPFNNIDTKPCADDVGRYSGREHIFAPAAGCALRKI